ncbi:hypothetical protein E2C01_042457 [Portunus trituberculatus]|uniref:Uncharacterized protein n=1 Tax=Portunus trituberculatus TaxID=210409 RepID=A0A5B7FTI1_PORTR|nr:hypothetical protein [Portunus trituberculatus]
MEKVEVQNNEPQLPLELFQIGGLLCFSPRCAARSGCRRVFIHSYSASTILRPRHRTSTSLTSPHYSSRTHPAWQFPLDCVNGGCSEDNLMQTLRLLCPSLATHIPPPSLPLHPLFLPLPASTGHPQPSAPPPVVPQPGFAGSGNSR